MPSVSALKWLLAGCLLGAGIHLLAPNFWYGESLGGPGRVGTGLYAGLHRAAMPDFNRLVERVGPAVVNVTTRSILPHTPDSAARHFEAYRGLVGNELPRGAVAGLGSGFVLQDDGYVLTNAHVVEGADEIYVRLTGTKRELRASIVGVDKGTDIALLKVMARGLRVAPLGSSEALKVGDWVAAIGSPFGFDNTITAGIISAKERHLSPESPMLFLQSDVAINPGSSGGPLVNLSGEVVGINSKIYTRSGGYMGVSFAIPIETALKVSAELRQRGFVARGYLGLDTQPLSDALATSFRLERASGALITSVQPDGPAGRSGLRAGDIVLSYAGRTIFEPSDLAREVAETSPGTRAEIEVWRKSARLFAAVMIESEPHERTPVLAPARSRASGDIGLELREAPPQQRKDLKIEFGLVVNEINRALRPGSLQLGDVIVAVNDNGFSTRAEFNQLLYGTSAATAPVALLVRRAGRSQYIAIDLGPL